MHLAVLYLRYKCMKCRVNIWVVFSEEIPERLYIVISIGLRLEYVNLIAVWGLEEFQDNSISSNLKYKKVD